MNTCNTIVLCLAAVIGADTTGVATTDYCDKDLCPWGTHIACGHNIQFDRSCPRDASLVKITTNLKEFILQLHNEKRNLVAGGGGPKHRPACRMTTMQWDDELAKLAELNVMQCKMKHDSCHNTKSFSMASQNLAFESFVGTPNDKDLLRGAVQGWYDEIKDCNMGIINKFPENYRGPVITHFTGLVLEHNDRVGCAASTYSVEGEAYKIYLVACNMGNLVMSDSHVYKSCRTPGSKCITGKNSVYSNLCNTSEKY